MDGQIMVRSEKNRGEDTKMAILETVGLIELKLGQNAPPIGVVIGGATISALASRYHWHHHMHSGDAFWVLDVSFG